MTKPERFISTEEAKAFYDRFGRKQDWQSFYEGQAIRTLMSHSEFETATSVFELGCGTGAFAKKLLSEFLSPEATYLGIDLSSTMVDLTRERIAPFGPRAEVRQSKGELRFDLENESFDRFISNYVLDLLPPDHIQCVVDESYRLLKPNGRICLTCLTCGKGFWGQSITWLWRQVHRLNPRLVGGCRPLELEGFLSADRWHPLYHNVISILGIASEILVAEKR